MSRITVLLAFALVLLSESSKADQVTYFTMAFAYDTHLSATGDQPCITAVHDFVESMQKNPPTKTTYEVYRGRIIQPVRGDFDSRTQEFKITYPDIYHQYRIERHISGVLDVSDGQIEVIAFLNNTQACALKYKAKLIF